MKRIISLGLMLLAVACEKAPEGNGPPREGADAASVASQAVPRQLSPSCQAAWDCCQQFSARISKGGSSPFDCAVLASQGPAGCEQSLQTFRSLSPRVRAQLPAACTR
jgi:hypothetical protein